MANLGRVRSLRRFSDERGQAMVEFALVLPILLLLVFSLFEFGSAFWTHQQLAAAANEGAREAIVSAHDSDREGEIQAAARGAAPGLDSSRMTVSVVSQWESGDPVTVTVTYPEKIIVMGITFFDGNLTSETTMRVQS
jgi:Flp pilus assembly protein TadG